MRCSMILACSILCLPFALAHAQSNRHIEVRVRDELGQPLADAQVAVRPIVGLAADDAFFEAKQEPIKIIGRTTTDSAGVAKVDIAEDAGVKDQDYVRVTAWKLGYSPSTVLVMKATDVRCQPLQRRAVQIVDSDGQPVGGLQISREFAPSEQGLFEPPWWHTGKATTDELGVARIDVSSGHDSLTVRQPDGTQHRLTITDLFSRMTGRPSDYRDMVVATIERHGKLAGTLPADFVKDYGLRVQIHRQPGQVSLRDMLTVMTDVRLEDDGKFEFPALAEGNYWLIVYRKTPYSEATEPLKSQPVPVHPVQVLAGQTTHIQITTTPLAKISGRVQSSKGSGDFSSFRLMFSQHVPTGPTTSSTFYTAGTLCKSDGTFVAWLPGGRYTLTPGSMPGWRLSQPTEFEVGSGAASVTVKDMVVVPTKTHKVVWEAREMSASLFQTGLFERLYFRLNDGATADCVLSADGYGKVEIPEDAKLLGIAQIPHTGDAETKSAFVDRDESDDFRLELVTKLQGRSTNIGIRGRVVDKQNQPIAGVPVTITLGSEQMPVVSQRGAVPPMTFGSNVIDCVLTQHDGSYTIPPRQLLRNIVIPSRAGENECKFTFTASLAANPVPIEQTQVFQSKPEDWAETQVNIPDLVVEHSLAGNRLTGKLLDAQGQPSVGEPVRLSDRRHTIGTLTDREGNFQFDGLAGPTWLLRQRDWSIHAVSDYAQPLVLKVDSSATSGGAASETGDSSAARDAAGLEPRLDRTQRLALAKELLTKLPNVTATLLADDAYLDRDKFLADMALRNDMRTDETRLQFIAFWTDLSDEQLERQAAAAGKDFYKASILRMLADRHPSVAAYERVMQAIQLPATDIATVDRLVLLAGEVGLKLFHLGALDAHRAKLKQLVDASEALKAGARAQIPLPAGTSFLGSNTAILCRALSNPEEFKAKILEQLQIDPNEINAEERPLQMQTIGIFARMFPTELFDLPRDRTMFASQAWGELGATNPLAAVDAARQGKVSTDALRTVIQAALEAKHPDAREAFVQTMPLLLRQDASRILHPLPTSRASELGWYEAARNHSADLGRMAAWLLAYETLNGNYDDTTLSPLPIREMRMRGKLAVAYAIADHWPNLSRQIVDQSVTRTLNAVESEFGYVYQRDSDFSLVAYFQPQATVELLLRLQKRIDEEMKNAAAAGQPGAANAQAFGKRISLAKLKMSCLRGLLLEKL